VTEVHDLIRRVRAQLPPPAPALPRVREPVSHAVPSLLRDNRLSLQTGFASRFHARRELAERQRSLAGIQ
jgi:hypothetical protein